MTVIYMADGIRVAEPDSDAQRLDLRHWLRGLAPGDLAAGKGNRLLSDADDRWVMGECLGPWCRR